MEATKTTDGHELHGVEAVLLVSDVAATIAYYRDTLGFHVDFEAGSPPIHARVSSGDRDGPSAARIRFEHSAMPGTPSCYLYIHVCQRLDDLFAVYRGRGVAIVSEPIDRSWGLRQFEIQDCNGYRLTFAAEL
jgi:catechol 2,3-dioxygenase-like lactoylglutathione lyase family enzyme